MVTLCIREVVCSVIVCASGSDVELCNSENMTKIRPFANLLFPLVVTIICIISQCFAALSDKQLCYDPDCSKPISLARTVLAYIANDREVMSFGINTDVKVFSKGAGKRTDLWGVEINGKRGYAPMKFLNEYKILQHKLQYEVPVHKFNGELNKAQSEKLESTTEKIYKTHPLLKNKLPHNDNGASPRSVKSIDESIVQESQVINVASVSPSYEVIDGTTFYSENEPSIQPNFVSEIAHATALLNEQASIDSIDSKINPDYKEPSSDKSTFINKELQTDINDASSKLEGIKLPLDIHKQTTDILLESSEAIINSTLDIVSKDDTLILDGSSKSKDESSKNLEHKEKLDNKVEADSSAEKNIKDNKKEGVESVESEGIFGSLTKTFNILSSSQDTAATEDTIQNDNDMLVPKAENDLQFKQVSEVEVKDTVTEKHVPTIQTKLDSNIDPSLNKEKIEIQQEIIHENIENSKILDEKTKIEEEASVISLENATSSSDVPLSNNFVHEDAAKTAKELPTTSSIVVDDSSTTSAKTDINSLKNIQIQETSKEEKVTENIKDVVVSLGKESIISPDLKETAATKSASIQSSNDIEQKLPESDKTHSENTKEDVNHKETIVQVTDNKVSETINLSSIMEITVKGNTTEEPFPESHTVGENIVIIDEALNRSTENISFTEKFIVHNNVNKNDNLVNDASSDNVPIEANKFSNGVTPGILGSEQTLDSSQKEISNQITNVNEVLQNQDLSNVEEDLEHKKDQFVSPVKEETLSEYGDYINSEDKVLYKDEDIKEDNNLEKPESKPISDEIEDKVCSLDDECTEATIEFLDQKEESESEEDNLVDIIKLDHNYWKTLMFLCVTAITVLVFTLGYYYIENIKRDGQLIARINTLEKEQSDLIFFIESIQQKLLSTQYDSCHSEDMATSLKADLAVSQNEKTKLEEQVSVLEKDLENATEAGLELERMLREVLSSNNEINPLAQSVEDLQARLDAQQTANESLTNALNIKAQEREFDKLEIETLSADLTSAKKKCEEFEVEFSRVQDELATLRNVKNNIEETLTDKVHNLEEQLDELFIEKSSLYKELKGKEIEVKELMEVINQIKSDNLDLEKLYDVFRIKIDTLQLREERDELKMRLNDVEGAHQLLEEHMKLVKEEIAALSDQCKIAEKEKKDAETRLEVLSKFFKEKEAERQKEEAMWLQKQGEVVSTVERIHTMQNEIQNYKQQVEILKREIVDQEREYKNQISALETKAHEQWVAARQNERRLEESKAEAGQLRNRLTLVEKNLNDTDSEIKLHRLEANGETVTSPSLFIGTESSSSPIMFSSSSGVPPPPPPSYLQHCFPPYLPPLPPTTSGLPPYDISQRPPPLGGRLSSPPPMPPPPLHPQFTSGGRSPPLLPFGGDRIPPLPPPGFPPPLGTTHLWGEESLPPPRNSGFHPHQREQRTRNHKGSLHSSGESLDKTHHGKV